MTWGKERRPGHKAEPSAKLSVADSAEDTADHGDRQLPPLEIWARLRGGFSVFDPATGGCIVTTGTYASAASHALNWATANGRRPPEAEIVPFPGGAV